MNKSPITAQVQSVTSLEFNRLPVDQRALAAERKYAEAVAMYAAGDLSVRKIAELCKVSAAGLCAHISRNHRPLMFARYGLDSSMADAIKVRQRKGQTLKSHLKYKDAIEACSDMAYIEYNVSQIARLFGLSGPALAAQLRVHYPEVITGRENRRRSLGIADNACRGARMASKTAYEEAVEMYRTTDMTVAEVADRCDVSKSGLVQFMRFYHKDALEAKALRRAAACNAGQPRQQGQLTGNGRLCGPKPETILLYAPALKLYESTTMTIGRAADCTGVPPAGFRAHISQWHKAPEAKAQPRYLKSAAQKYASAIKRFHTADNNQSVAEIAAEFGLNADVFRQYLKTHCPELAAAAGMMRRADGRLVKKSSSEKYAAAISEYADSADTLKDIALRHGLVYNSLLGYVLRNCPEERERHNQAVARVAAAQKSESQNRTSEK